MGEGMDTDGDSEDQRLCHCLNRYTITSLSSARYNIATEPTTTTITNNTACTMMCIAIAIDNTGTHVRNYYYYHYYC